MPSPASSSGNETTSAPTPTSSAAANATIPTNKDTKPNRTTRRGDALGKNFGTPTAATSRASERGSRRKPVWIADRPSAIERNKGTVKNRPACNRYWK